MALNIDNIEYELKTLGYDIARVSSRRIRIFTSKNHVEILRRVADHFRKLRCSSSYQPNIKGIQHGIAMVDGITIIAKGRANRSYHSYETEQIKSINKQIQTILEENGYDYVPIKVKDTTYKCVSCTKSNPNSKSDFCLIDIDGKECIWISHKAGRTPKDFQQWGGLTENYLRGSNEVNCFIEDVKSMLENNAMKQAESFCKTIKSNIIKKKAVYGKNYIPGGRFGENNVTYVMQGNISIKPTSNGDYFLEAINTFINGSDITGDYTPVFMCTYRGDRHNFNIKDARAGIYPMKSRICKHNLDKKDKKA